MNNENYKKFFAELRQNYDDFQDLCCNTTTREMFDNIYMIFTYDRIYDFLLSNAKDWNIKYLQKTDILNYYYDKFTNTNYELTRDDLREFFKDQMEIKKRELNSEDEM